MSAKEMKRRKIIRTVFYQAWKLLKRTKSLEWKTVLKLSWSLVRSRTRIHYSKVYGVAASGTPRQARLKQLLEYKPEEVLLRMVREPNNHFDSNAIRIIGSLDGDSTFTLGYLKQSIAATISPLLDSGHTSIALMENISGYGSKGLLGFNFRYAVI